MKKYNLFTYLRKYMALIILSILLAVIIVALQILSPFYIGKAIDALVEVNNVSFSECNKYLTYTAIITIIICFVQFIMTNINNTITFNIVRDIRNDAIKKIEELPISYLDSRSYGDILSNVIVDVETIADGLLLGFTQLFTGVITLIGTLVLMFIISWKIALIVLLVSPLGILAAKFIASSTHNMFVAQARIRGEQTSFIEEIVNNQKVVQAFSHEDECIDTFDEINNRLYKASLKANFYSSTTNPTTRFINYIVYSLVCLFGAINVVGGAITIGNLSTLLMYANQYAKPFNDISGVIAELQNAIACSNRVFNLLNQKGKPSELNKKELINPSGNFKIQNVYFSYNKEKPLIQDFNLDVKKGQVVAIVGPTGCGKTTFINLLMRFYDVDSGSISIDDVNTQEFTRKSLRKSIGMVLQDCWLKTGTIRENIIIGKPDATDEEIIKACKESHSYHFIMQLKDGLDTYINEDGGNLSQGQKQLLCITRIMLCRPNILILDEATSSIDTRTEIKIQEAFTKLMKNRTSFIVAHRLSTIRNADIILVMKDGNIIEKGSHQELLDKKGFFYELYNSQFSSN